jgi:hypothetical protein
LDIVLKYHLGSRGIGSSQWKPGFNFRAQNLNLEARHLTLLEFFVMKVFVEKFTLRIGYES